MTSKQMAARERLAEMILAARAEHSPGVYLSNIKAVNSGRWARINEVLKGYNARFAYCREIDGEAGKDGFCILFND